MKVSGDLAVTVASDDDLPEILRIYNEGIADRIATLDVDLKSKADIENWFAAHGFRYAVLVARRIDAIVGWASLNRFSAREAHQGVADLSIYVAREARGLGVGSTLFHALEKHARGAGFTKIVLATLLQNEPGRRLYRRAGYPEVGIYERHGLVDGIWTDIRLMEKLFL